MQRVEARRITLVDAVVPWTGLWRDALLIVGFSAFVALCGRVRFYLPDNPVPITLQTMGVLLTGAALGSRRGLLSLLLFYFAGMAGAPVFQGGNNGWQYVSTSATGGYLIGFILAGYVTGVLAERGWDKKHAALWTMLIANLLIYLPGLLWLGAKGYVPWENVLSKGFYPFIPGDLVKLMAASLVLPSAWALVRRSGK